LQGILPISFCPPVLPRFSGAKRNREDALQEMLGVMSMRKYYKNDNTLDYEANLRHSTDLFSHLSSFVLEKVRAGGDIVNGTLTEITLLRRNITSASRPCTLLGPLC